jgi:hypothetical protein
MRGGFVAESAQHTGASCFFKVQSYPELTLSYSAGHEVPHAFAPEAWGAEADSET